MSSPATNRSSDTITTERLLLRPLSPADSQGVFAIRSDPRVFYWTEPDTREQSDGWIKARLENDMSMCYTVSPLPSTDDPSPSIIGLTGAHCLPEIGYVFAPTAWGQGYATEALKAWIHMYWQKYADGHPALPEDKRAYLKAVTGPGGDGSRGVLRKCGFRWFSEEESGDERKGAKEDSTVVLQEFRLARPSIEAEIYGRPDSNDCMHVLNDYYATERALHCFAPAGFEQPGDVTNSQWERRVNIPKFSSHPLYPNCRVALLPVQNSSDGSLAYDVSRYMSIWSVGRGINHYCVEALGMPGVQGTGGIESTGDNSKLRLILYAAGSKFENDTIADYSNNKPIGIQEDTDDEYEPGPPDPPPPKKRARSGGMGLMTSKGVQTRTRSLGDGWYMTYDSITSIIPTQIGAANLEAFYTQVLDSAAEQISNIVNATADLAFDFHGLTLRLSSAAPISWTWVINFAADMLDNVSTDFAVLFAGEAYSDYWEIAAVTAVLTSL